MSTVNGSGVRSLGQVLGVINTTERWAISYCTVYFNCMFLLGTQFCCNSCFQSVVLGQRYGGVLQEVFVCRRYL